MPSHKYSLITLLLSLMLAAFAQNLSQVQNVFTSPNNYPAWEVAYSPDGSLLAVALGGEANSIKILDTDSGRQVASLVGHTGGLSSVAFSPDGAFLASGSANNTVEIWRTNDFSLVASLEEHTDSVNSVAFNPAGDFLASGSDDNTIKIWRTNDFSLVASLEEHTDWVRSVAFSPAGDFLASGSVDNTVKIWRTNDFSLVASLEEHTSYVFSVAFSPAGDFLAAGSHDATVKIWRTADFSFVTSLEEHAFYVTSVAFSPAGDFLASGSRDNTVKIWHVNDSFSLHKTIAGAIDSRITSVAFHPTGASLAVANMQEYSNVEGVVSLWGTPSRQAVFCPSGCGAVQYVDVTIYSTAGARVLLDGRVLAESSTGVFTTQLEAGAYQVQASKDGYRSASGTLEAQLNGANQLALILQENPSPIVVGVDVSPVENTDSSPPPVPMAQRKALVIGNSNYQQAPLDNPENDARAMSAALQRLGFQVETYYDLNFRRMREVVRGFKNKLSASDVALVYFAGHGAEVNGENYLIPTDAYFDSPDIVKDEALALSSLLESLASSRSQLNIVILDACRNNPFKGDRNYGDGGLAAVSDTAIYRDFISQARGAQGVLISFSTSPKATAADGYGNNSPYTAALLQRINTPNITMEEMFKDVRELVLENTGGRQRPWENSTVVGDFYFVPRP